MGAETTLLQTDNRDGNKDHTTSVKQRPLRPVVQWRGGGGRGRVKVIL